jgi:nucleoporin NUP82
VGRWKLALDPDLGRETPVRLAVYIKRECWLTCSEYDITSPYDPSQTFTFLSDQPSSSRFTAVDPLSRYATSFAFAPYNSSTFDFTPLMVYVLIANGDLYTMGPVMPIHAEIPLRYLQGLKAFTDARLKQSKHAGDVFSDEGARATLQAQWVDGLVRQVKKVEGKQGEVVRLHPPHLTETGGPAPGLHRSVMLQGPVIFSPGSQEVGAADDEDAASDLAMVEDMLAIAWSGGRVDLGVRRTIEPRWISSRVGPFLV